MDAKILEAIKLKPADLTKNARHSERSEESPNEGLEKYCLYDCRLMLESCFWIAASTISHSAFFSFAARRLIRAMIFGERRVVYCTRPDGLRPEPERAPPRPSLAGECMGQTRDRRLHTRILG